MVLLLIWYGVRQVLETERGVLREVMATARKAVGEMNRQNEVLTPVRYRAHSSVCSDP